MDKTAFVQGFQEELEKVGIAPVSILPEIIGGAFGVSHAIKKRPLTRRHAYARFITRHPGWSMFIAPGGLGYTLGRVAGGEPWTKTK